MKQKVIKIGSSIGVVIPKPIVQKLGLYVGQEYEIKQVPEGLLITPLNPKPKIDPKILAWVDEFIEKNRELLLRLADKKPEDIEKMLNNAL